MAKKSNYTIAILDEEALERGRFVKFLKDEFTIVQIPFASSVDDLISKIKELGVDAIAIDYKLKDHDSRFKENGDFFFKNLIAQLQGFPAFILTKDADKARKESKLINPRFIISKRILYPKLASEEDRIGFKDILKYEIQVHQAVIQDKTKRVNALEKLRLKNKLDESQENEYIELNNELSKMITGHNEIPMKFFSVETNKKLDDIISKTDALIKKIGKKKK
ncbi:MAG: hypothetical protein JWO09_3572 [Bacteroidetes bacterium]|nr:hypothetical protein [Bacteroidota bacterium]